MTTPPGWGSALSPSCGRGHAIVLLIGPHCPSESASILQVAGTLTCVGQGGPSEGEPCSIWNQRQ